MSVVAWSRVRLLLAGLVALLSVALVMTMSPWADIASADPKGDPSTQAPAESSADWVSPTGADPVRPDWLSASLTARGSGHRVEVLSARTESSRSWVLPSGEVSSELTGEVRFRDPAATDQDGWRDIDTTLKANADGTVAPVAVPGSLKLSGGGDADTLVAYTSESGHSVKLGSGLPDAVLPTPTLDGSTAIYPDVLPGVDVRVEARASGFEQLWVIKDHTGLDNLTTARADGDMVSLQAPMTVSKTSVAPATDGSVEFTDSGSDTKVGELKTPIMWDGDADAQTGLPTNVEPVDFTVSAGNAELTPLDPAKTGKLALSVDADKDWLTDPVRTFPITIDPTYEDGSSQVTFDTYVRNGDTTDHSSGGEFWLGYDGTAASRSFLNVSTSGLSGRKIMSGSLTLWETWAASCTASAWSAYTAGTASTSTRWTAQPTIGSKYATSTATKGYSSSCAAGEVSIDMKSQLQAWADAGASSQGLLVRADSETDPLTFKRFASADSAHAPKLTWTSNRAPDKTPAPLVVGSSPYKAAGDSVAFPYTANTKPTVSAVLTDADADTMAATFQASTSSSFGTIASSCTTGSVASAATASCALSTTLATDGRYYLRVRAQDANGAWGSYSDTVEFRVAAVTPAAPVISCPAPYSNGAWQTTGPSADVSCTITATGTGYSAPSRIGYAIDGNPTSTTAAITQSSSASVAKVTVTIKKTVGGHSVSASAYGPAGVNAASSFYTGWGNAPLLKRPNPAAPRITTADKVQILANGPGNAGTVTGKTQWRVSGATDPNAGWVDAPTGNAVTITQIGGQSQADGYLDTNTLVGLSDGASVTVNARVSTLIDVRACLTIAGTTTCSAEYATILRVPHAFGSGFPTTDAGPGQVALWTGELSVDDSDAALPTPTGGLSVSRSHLSFSGTPAVQNAVFGPGWVASFDGDDSGAGGAELFDGTPGDGTLAVVSSDGDVLVYSTPTGARRTTSTIPTGTYTPADEDTQTSGTTLVVSGSGASTIAEVKGDDGIVTKFQVTAAPTTAAATFRTIEVREPATGDKSTYSYDTSGRVTAITAALPDGVSSCVPGTRTAGCRVLKISYATATTATSTTPGDFINQVKTITAQVNTDTDRELAAYSYDTSGRLVEAKDSRSGLVTGYGWTGTGTGLRLASLTPPGEAAYTFTYDTAANKIKSVTRPNPASAGGGTAQLAAFVYGVPTSGTGLPDLPTATDAWQQAKTPTWGAAVFGPDQVVSGTTPAAVTDPEWWNRADLQYTDANGYTVNTVDWGGGDWQYTASDYDATGNIVRSLDQRGTRALLSGDTASGGADQYATLTTYNDDITNSSGDVVTPAGTLVTDTYGPMQQVVSADGSLQMLRTHTNSVYDEGAPNAGINPDTSQPYRLPTTVTTTSEAADGTVNQTLTRNITGYDAVVSGDTSGWALGQATTSTVDMDLSGTVNSGDITTKTRYDARGRTIENRQPKSTGSDAGTRTTSYYTGASSGPAGCTSKPEWAGMVCQVGPAAQPAGQTMPVTKTTSYTWDLQTATAVDTSGSVTSTTTTSFDAKDRPTTTGTTVTGLASSTAVPAVTTAYDDATGDVTGTTSTAGSTAMTYDTWGRQLTYTNTPAGQTGDTGTTTYNALGQVVSVVDGNGQTSYIYDGTDANGTTETRGLVTQVKVKITGGTEYTSTGAYDSAGALTTEKFPGNIIRRTTVDPTGRETGVAYNGQATDSTGALAQDQPWIAWTSIYTPLDQLNRQWAPNSGAAVRGRLGTTASALNRSFGYDRAGRLSFAKERYTNGDLVGANQQCVSRTYAFDANGNRISNNTVDPAADGSCTTTGGSPISHAYDAADRLTTGGNGTGSYVYDELGRQTTIPAADAPHSDRGNITLGYYDSDAVKTITQNGQTTSFTLDGAARRLNQTTSSNTLVRHYTDGGDNPTWSVDTTGSATTTTRYAELIDGDLGLTLTTVGGTTTAQFDLATPRDDIAATITLPTGATAPGGTSATGLDSWTDYTEYGTPRQSVDTTPGSVTGIGYGWLGTKQRASLDAGLTLMGARLYNPSTGLFTSVDPIYGGNTTAYAYPQDPINTRDLDGNYAIVLVAYAIPGLGEALLIATLVVAVAYAGYQGYKRYKTYKYYHYRKAKTQGAKNQTNSHKIVKTRRGAINAAKQHAKRTGGKYRGPCKSKGRPHCHVDYSNGKGEVKHTKHFYWRNWR